MSTSESNILFSPGGHAAHNRQNTTKCWRVEDGAMVGDLGVDEKVWVDDRGEKEDGSKRTSHERCESTVATASARMSNKNLTGPHFMTIASFSWESRTCPQRDTIL